MDFKNHNHRVFIGIGSNIEPRQEHLQEAIDGIGKICSILQKSSVLETTPVGFEASTNFLNMVVEVSTELTPRELLMATQEIEIQIGRKSKSANGVYVSRKIDLDILYFGPQILITPDFVIPHPRLYEREFVLKPLNEIAPDFVDPMHLQTISELLENCAS
jgi:2-amino-4-hydroxy-6-hydroxymethyldihydropteridine diphosphokinase